MAESFRELGLGAELVNAAARAGYEAPTPLQSAAVPVIRRGGNAVIRGSSGAGVLAAYGLGLLDRLAPAAGAVDGDPAAPERGAARALILAPTTDEATRLASSLGQFASAVGLSVRALARGWSSVETGTDIAIAAPGPALDAVQSSALKLETAIALVVHDAAAILELGDVDAVETLTNSMPRDSQRVVVSGETDGAVGEYVERHVRRPLHVPARPAVEGDARAVRSAGTLGYAVVASGRKLDAVAAVLLDGGALSAAAVHCRTRSRAERVAAGLLVRGLPVAASEDADAPILVTGPRPAESRDLIISYDVPFDAESLTALHAGGGMVLAEPREVPHLRRIAEEAGFSVESRPAGPDPGVRDSLDQYRERILAAARAEDLAAQLLVLDPLFEVLSPAEVAAAVSALLRQKPVQPVEVAAAPATRRQAPAAAPAETRTWTRLFISAGSRDGIRPGDLVGSITGETGLAGEQVGRIEIRDTFSIVEVDSEQARRVIDSLNGTTLRGRSLRVDYDRRTTSAGTRRGSR